MMQIFFKFLVSLGCPCAPMNEHRKDVWEFCGCGWGLSTSRLYLGVGRVSGHYAGGPKCWTEDFIPIFDSSFFFLLFFSLYYTFKHYTYIYTSWLLSWNRHNSSPCFSFFSFPILYQLYL